ncbi:MAG: ISNCY family transposase, partial [Advenella sp.]
MGGELLKMSHRELDRVQVIQDVIQRHLTQAQAARRLQLSRRQVKRLVRRYRTQGAGGLISRRRGQPSNNRIAAAVRAEYLLLVREHYPDFGPSFAHEKLVEQHGFRHSVETLRHWMIADGLWRTRASRAPRPFQIRARRPCRGEMVQIDGSPHDWFEGRARRCALIVFIDDATGELLALRFAPGETTEAYMRVLRDYLAVHGRPVSLYSDRHSVFRVNAPDREGELTQFGRALHTLDIEAIHARTPQAKGRVERANQTLQDRLIKEMRLAGIHSIEAANAWLPSFIADYNRRFAITPEQAEDAHRRVLHSEAELDLILCLHHQRTLSKNLTLQCHNRLYQVENHGKGYRLRHTQVTVCEGFDGAVTLLHQGKALDYS